MRQDRLLLVRLGNRCAIISNAQRSPEHQKLDWKRHKKECKLFQGGAKPADMAAAAASQSPGFLESRADLLLLSVRDLRARCAARGLDATGAIEKTDLVNLLFGGPGEPLVWHIDGASEAV